MAILKRRLVHAVMSTLAQFPAAVVSGARQVGKSTLSRAIAQERECVFYDLENSSTRALLATNTVERLTSHKGKLVVLDEVQQMPNIFMDLRVAIDQLRRENCGKGTFLLMGSAQGELLRQTRESLTGRADYMQLHGLDLLELGDQGDVKGLWERGGFPDSYLATTDHESMRWRKAHINGTVARDFREGGADAPFTLVQTMLQGIAEGQGSPFKLAAYARDLGITQRTLAKYLNVLEMIMVVRRLPAFSRTARLRTARRPKMYLCDSGIMHALLDFEFSHDELPSRHRLMGASWEGFVIENLMAVLPWGWRASYYRDYAGNEVDLVLERPGDKPWAIEIKSGNPRRPSAGFRKAIAEIDPDRAFQVCGGTAREQFDPIVESVLLGDMMAELLRQDKALYTIADKKGGRPVAREATPVQAQDPLAEPAVAQAPQAGGMRHVKIRVFGDGAPLPGADLLAVQHDKSWVRATTDEQGVAHLKLISDKHPMLVLAACSGYGAVTEPDWIPRERALAMNLPVLPAGGSLILPDSHGEVPGLHGTITPARDRDGHLWMYAGGITVGDGASRPVSFEFGKDLDMRDAQGNAAQVLVVDIIGQASLLEYRTG